MTEGRVVVLGKDYQDARFAAHHRPVVGADDQRAPTYVAGDGHLLTIEGSLGGMTIARAYVTPAAHRGQHYEGALAAIRRCIERKGGEVIHLDSEGGTYADLEA